MTEHGRKPTFIYTDESQGALSSTLSNLYLHNFPKKSILIVSTGVLVVKSGDSHVAQVHVLQVKVDKVLLLPGVHSVLVEPENINF